MDVVGRQIAELSILTRAVVSVSWTVIREEAFRERLRLQALAEMFNTLNRVNIVTLNGVFGTGAYPANTSATFRQITAVNPPRSAPQ